MYSLIDESHWYWQKTLGWKSQFDDLLEFQRLWNTTIVPSEYALNPKLSVWAKQQRKGPGIDQDKIVLLDAIDFQWQVSEVEEQQMANIVFDTMFGRLSAYHERFLTTIIPKLIHPSLWKWMQWLRKNQEHLSKSQKAQLESIEFEFEPVEDEQWTAMFHRYLAYIKNENTTSVPKNCFSDVPLGNWAQNLRTRLGKYLVDGEWDWELLFSFHSMEADVLTNRVELLEGKGFIWDPLEVQWLEFYRQLKYYLSQHNNKWPTGGTLSRWVLTQRAEHNAGSLTNKRINLLNEIGFEWDPYSAQWDQMFKRLEVYVKTTGTALVPQNYSKDPELGHWVNTQRNVYRKEMMVEDHIARLNMLGFKWDPINAKWEERFHKFELHFNTTGSALVSMDQNQEVRRWVVNQRIRYKKGRMPMEQIDRLFQA